MFGHRDKTVVPAEEVDRLREAYRGLGPGFPDAAARLFEQDTDAEGGEWYVKVFGRLVRRLRVGDMTSSDLFALPSTWEVMRAEVRGL